MKKSKQLIFEDEKLMDFMRKDLKFFIPYLEEIKVKYNALELEPLNDQVYKEMISTGVTLIRERYEEKINLDIKAVGIGSTLFKENLMNGAKEKVVELKKAVDAIKSVFPKRFTMENTPLLSIRDISYTKGGFAISKEDEEAIMEKSGRVYLNTPEEFEMYSNLQEFLKAFEKVNNTLVSAGIHPVKNVGEIESSFLNKTNVGLKINPHSINWILHLQPKMQAERAEKGKIQSERLRRQQA